MDMTAAEQGVYRNLLDEAWLRRGPIPNNARTLAKASGDAEAWPKVKQKVLAHFTLTADGWRHETLDAVRLRSARNAERQARHRAKHACRNGESNGDRNALCSMDPDPDPDLLIKIPPNPPFSKGGKPLTRKETDAAAKIRARAHGGCPHDPRCRAYDACVNRIAYDRRQGKAS
jgi:hypothetical protein